MGLVKWPQKSAKVAFFSNGAIQDSRVQVCSVEVSTTVVKLQSGVAYIATVGEVVK